MALAWKCDICGKFETNYRPDGKMHGWFLGDVEKSVAPMSIPKPLDVCQDCFEFLEKELVELRERINIRKKQYGAKS